MIIEKIIYKENLSLFELEIDNEKFLISYDFYDNNNIKNSMEIDENLYEEIEFENTFQLSKKLASNFINYKFRTRKEVENKIWTKYKNSEVISLVIEYFTKLGMIDDDRYCQEFIDYASNIKKLSKNDTKNKLIQKGIKTEIINKYIDTIDDDIEFENAKTLFEKKYKNINIEDRKAIEKVYRYFISKGYSYHTIKKVMEL